MRTFVIIGMLFCVLCSSAQVKRDSVRVYFRQGKSVVDLRYLNNTSHFSLLAERYRQYSRNPQYWLKGIRIVSSASPEASFSLNDRLSQKRADAVLHFLKSQSWLDGSMLQVQPLGEDWKGLRRLVETDPNVPSREAVLESLQRYPDGQEGEWDLKQIADGQSYRYLYNQIYPLLRQTNVVFDVVQERELQYPGRISFKRDMVMPEKRLSVSHELEMEQVRQGTEQIAEIHPFALKTNLLYDALLSPSIEAEYRFAPRWSAHVDFAIAWWSKKSKHKYYQIAQLSPEIRYWFNDRQFWKGHYIGAFVGAGHYDLENGKDGYKGEFMMGGLSYGYMFPIGRYLSLDAGIGVGYLNTEYEEYLPIEGHYVYQQTSRTGYVGPLKARLSLVWHFGRNWLKGGKR